MIHSLAEKGFSNATTYDTHRPTYPATAVAQLLVALNVSNKPSARIIDLAAGTGKFTEVLVNRDEGYEIMAVEPQKDMLGVLREKGLEGVRCLEGGAESMGGVGEGWADAVVVAQAFHWFPTFGAIKEIHRVLKPGGSLGLIWNFDDVNSRLSSPPATAYEGRIRAVSRSYEDRPGDRAHSLWPAVFGGQSLFDHPVEEGEVAWENKRTREEVWERLATVSHLASLKGEEREEARRRVLEAMEGEDCVEDKEGKITTHGKTLFYWTKAL